VKRLLLAWLCVLGLIPMVGCQVLGDAGGARVKRIVARGELRVGISGSQPPLNMHGADGKLRGFEVDIIRALAESMGLRLRFVTQPFAELLPALEKGQVDLVISGVTMTAARNARVAFAGPYLISGKSVLAREGRVASVDTPELLDKADRSWVVLAGSTSERFAREMLPKSHLVTTPYYDSGVKMVIAGKVDGLIADFPACAWAAGQHPDAHLVALSTPFTVEPLGIALPPDDPLFINLVQNYLTTLRETGLLSRFKARWLSGEPLDEGASGAP